MTLNAIALSGRILLALLFVLGGAGKVMAPGDTLRLIEQAGLPLPQVALVIAALIELGGGLLLAVGYQTRFAAIVLAGFTLAVALIFHHALGDPNQLAHFFKNIAIVGGLLQIVAFGTGALSVDARRTRTPALAAQREPTAIGIKI